MSVDVLKIESQTFSLKEETGMLEGRFFVKYAIDDLERVSQSLFDKITVRKFKELGLIK